MPDHVQIAPVGLPAGSVDGGYTASMLGSANIEDQVTNAKDWLNWNMPAGVVAGFADTVLQTVGVMDKGDMQKLLAHLDQPLGQYYNKHNAGLRTVGDLAGSMIPALGATKLMRADSILGKFVGDKFGADAAKMIFSTGKPITELTETYKQRAMLLAKYGEKTFAGATADKQLLTLAKQAKLTTFTDLMKEGLAADLAVYATMRDSDTLFPDELSGVANATIALGFNTAFAGIGTLAARFAMKRALINDVGPIVESVANQSKLPITDALSHPDIRGAGITIKASMLNTAEAEKAYAGNNSVLRTNMDRTITTFTNELKQDVDMLGRDNVIPNVTTKYSPTNEEIENTVHAVKKDPGLLIGARSLEPFNIEDPAAFLRNKEARLKWLGETIDGLDQAKHGDKIAALKLEKSKLESTTAFVVENDGSISNLRTRKPMFQDQERWQSRIQRSSKSDEGILWKADASVGSKRQIVGFTSTGHVLVANTEREIESTGEEAVKTGASNIGNAKFDSLDMMGRSAIYAAAQKSIKHVDVSKLGDIVINEKTHHTRIDWVLELLDDPKLKNAVAAKIKLPAGKTLADLNLMALDSKMLEYGRLRDQIDKAAVSNLKQPASQKTTLDDLTKMLNLPGGDSGGAHPLVQLFEDKRIPGKAVKLSSFIKNEDQLKEALVKLTAPNELGEPLTDIAFRGNMMRFAPDRKPVVIAHYERPDGYVTRQELVDKVAMQQEKLQQTLFQANQQGAELVGLVHQTLLQSPDMLRQAKDVGKLTEGSQLYGDRFVQLTHALRENPTVLAADTAADITDKIGRQWIKSVMQPHTPVFTKLLSNQYKGDLENLALARNSIGQGWDLLEDAVSTTNGKFHLLLDPDSAFNKQRWEEIYKVPMPEGAVEMPGPLTKLHNTPTPLEITPLAMEGLNSLRDLGATALKQTNFLRMAEGKATIPFKQWHLPPKNLNDKALVFLVDDAGNFKQVVSAHSEAAAHRQAEQEIAKASADRGENLHKFTYYDVQQYYTMMDEAKFGRPANFAKPELLTGRATGKSFGQVVEVGPDMLIDMINSTTSHLDDIIKRTRGLVFKGEVQYAHSLRSMSGASASAQAAKQTIWDQYINRIYGKPTLNNNTVIGKAYYNVESAYDHMLTAIADKFDSTISRRASSTEKASYEALQKSMGNSTPFQDMADYIEHTYRVTLPPTARKQVAALNEITSFAALRILQVGPALINFLGLSATVPAVVKGMARRSDQTLEQWKAAISAWGSPVTEHVATWSPTRAAISGLDFMFGKDSATWLKVKQDAMRHGYLQQEVAEALDEFTAPTQGYLKNLLRNKARLLSSLVDRSEVATRSIAFATGYRMGKENLQLAHEDAMVFAHKFANLNIGDYRPNNRPQIFQGAAGMSLGLFTTFMWNFLQRVGANIEARQYGALLAQAGMQFTLFGAQSMPGFNQFVQLANSSMNESTNLIDGMNNRFGHDATEWFLNGTLSNLPKLFGADTGVALYSRADINLPFSRGGDIFGQIPSFNLIKQTAQGLTASINQIVASGKFDLHQQSEILQRYSVVNGLRPILEMAHGYSINRAGELINADTWETMSAISRVMGFKTSQETDLQTEMARGRAARMAREEQLALLKDRLRSASRDGLTGDKLRETLNDAVRAYIKAGGTPEGFRGYFAAQMLAGTVEKGQRELVNAIKDSYRRNEAVRLLYLQDKHYRE